MKLGLLITTDKHLDHIEGITRAASAKGHEVALFCMDKGTRLVEQKGFRHICQLNGVQISLCRHSAEEFGVDTNALSKDIVCGSQFNNAMMNSESDKVIVM